MSNFGTIGGGFSSLKTDPAELHTEKATEPYGILNNLVDEAVHSVEPVEKKIKKTSRKK